MAHLALTLLGPFQATLDEEPVAPTASRLQALLAYLAVEAERAHAREALAGLLWPEQPDREALTSLRYALSNLRRALQDRQAQPSFLSITRHAVQFNRASDHWLDVNDFGFLISDFRFPGSEPGSQQSQIENLKSAIGLYRGEFLEGLVLGDSPAFEEWLLLKREQFHCQVLTALQRLAALHELRGEYELAAAYARRHLALEPWDEAAHRRLMRLLALGGQRSAALALLRRVGCCNHESEIRRVRGELLLLRDEAEAEKCFWRAIEVARQPKARWWELRAVVSLARLWQAGGTARRRQAREMLADVCNWFTEGFDLPDLREARALVRDLAPKSGS